VYQKTAARVLTEQYLLLKRHPSLLLEFLSIRLGKENHTVRKWESRATAKEYAQDVFDVRKIMCIDCSVRCHPDDNCGSLSELSVHTEMALIERDNGGTLADNHGTVGGHSVHVQAASSLKRKRDPAVQVDKPGLQEIIRPVPSISTPGQVMTLLLFHLLLAVLLLTAAHCFILLLIVLYLLFCLVYCSLFRFVYY